MKSFLEIIRPSSGGADSPPLNQTGGVYACSEELRNRWGEQDEEGNSRLELELERIRAGTVGPEEIVDLRGASLLDVELAGVDLRGADLRGADLCGADFSRAVNFQQGCILVDASTEYDAATKFPPGFELLDELTLGPCTPALGSSAIPIPEPGRTWLQATALALLALLAYRRRERSGLARTH